MFADVYHSVASHFVSRLHPLQFRRGPSVEDRVSALESGRKAQSTPAAASQNLHTQGSSAAPQSTAWAKQMGQRLAEKHDRVDDADHARVMQRSGDLLQSIRNTAAAHRAAAPLPEERHQDSMSRSGDLLNRIREEQARSDSSAPSTSGRTLRAPAPTTAPTAAPTAAPKKAPTTAPMHSPGGVGKGVQRGLFSPKEAGPRVKATPEGPEPKVVDPYSQSGPGIFPRSAVSPAAPSPVKNTSQFPAPGPKTTAPRAKRSGAKPAPTAPKSPSGSPAPRTSDAALDAMVDSWTRKSPAKSPAKSKGDLGPGYTPGREAPNPPSMPAKGSVSAPAAASSSASNIRETKVKVHGVEKTVRTEHSGTSKQLETMHTQRVKDAINELHVAGRDKALQAFDRTPAKPGQGEKEIAAQRKRLQGDSITSPVAHQKLSKQFPKVGRSQKKAAEKVKDFMGDGPDDPKRSHNYGL